MAHIRERKLADQLFKRLFRTRIDGKEITSIKNENHVSDI